MNKIILLIIAAIIFLAVINSDNPCDKLKGQSYNDTMYQNCMINYMKGL